MSRRTTTPTHAPQGLTPAEAAAYLGIGLTTLRKLQSDPKGPKYRVVPSRVANPQRRKVVYPVAALDRWLEVHG